MTNSIWALKPLTLVGHSHQLSHRNFFIFSGTQQNLTTDKILHNAIKYALFLRDGLLLQHTLYTPVLSKKHKGRPDGLVFSTDSNYYNDFQDEPAADTLPKEKQKLRIKLDTKQRAGKVVTLVEGFIGTNDDLEALGKQLKTKCGTGGSAKDGLIIIQGDYKEKIINWLKDWGYVLTK